MSSTLPAGHRREHPDGKFHVPAAEIVLSDAFQHELPVRYGTAHFRHFDPVLSRKVFAGDRIRRRDDVLDASRRNHFAAVHAGSGTDVHDVVRRPYGFLIVFDDDERIAEVAQPFERGKQLLIVLLVQPYARLVENVQHARKPAAYLCGEPYALTLAAGKRGGRPREREIAESHVRKEAQTRVDLLENTLDYQLLRGCELHGGQKLRKFHHRHAARFMDIPAADGDAEGFRLKPFAAARGARHLFHVSRDLHLDHLGIRFVETAQEIGSNALVSGVIFTAERLGAVLHGDLISAVAVEDEVKHPFRQIFHGHVQRKAVLFGKRAELHLRDLARVDIPAARTDRALTQRHVRADDELVHIYLVGEPQPSAHGARAIGVVERKQPRRELLDADPAVGTRVFGGIQHLFAVVIRNDEPFRELYRRFDGFGKAAVDAVLDDQPVNDDADVVLDVLVEVYLLVERVIYAVHTHADVAGTLVRFKLFDVFALPAAHDGRNDLQFHAGAGHDPVRDLIHRLPHYLSAALRTMRYACARVKQTHVVVYLRHRAHGGAGIAGSGFLIYGNGG